MNFYRYSTILLYSFMFALILLMPGWLQPMTVAGAPFLEVRAPVDGHWTGTTNRGRPMSFEVLAGGTAWDEFTLQASFPGCNVILTLTLFGPGPITNNQFSGATPDGTFSFSGQFTSVSAANGTYNFIDKPIPGCGNVNQSGTWTASNNSTPDPPDPPSNLTATAISKTQINLSWTDNSDNESGFKIERSPTGVSNWTQIATVEANVETYSDTGRICGTRYYYRVRAFNASDDSDYSNTANAMTFSCDGSLNPPTNLIASAVSPIQIVLSWSDSNTNVSFKIEQSLDGTNWTQIATTPATGHAPVGLHCATPYFYRVRAYRGNLHSDYSNIDSATTLPCVGSPPAAPSNLITIPISKTQISLSWTDNSDNESGFRIERSLDGVSWAQLATRAANVVTYTNVGLTCSTPYTYRVHAYNFGGYSDLSNTASATTLSCDGSQPPIAPSNLTAASVSQTQIDLSWTDNSNNETGFKIERSPDESNWTQIDTVGANVITYANTNLICGTTYYYQVRAYNAVGDSAPSSTDNATTFACPSLDPPTNLTTTAVSASQINLAWQDNSNNEGGFKIERSPDGINGWTEIGAVGANITTYADTGLSCNTPYFYRVQAFNTTDNSDYSDSANATTFACIIYLPIIRKDTTP